MAKLKSLDVTTPQDILEFIMLDDEMMADLDAIPTMGEGSLASAVVRAGRDADRATGIEQMAAASVRSVEEELLAEMRSGGVTLAADVCGDRVAVYRRLVRAAEAAAAHAPASATAATAEPVPVAG